jgi:hypothetical protein
MTELPADTTNQGNPCRLLKSRFGMTNEKKIPISRPDWSLTSEQIVKLHAQNKPVPITEYTVVMQEKK